MNSILLFVIFFTPVCFKSFRNNVALLLCLWLTILVMMGVAITNAFYMTTVDASHDAVFFYNNALLFGHMNVPFFWNANVGSYVQILGEYFKVFNASHLLGEQLSIFVYTLSAITLVKLAELFDAEKLCPIMILLLGLLPNLFFHAAITLRDVYEMFFLMLACFFVLKLLKHLVGSGKFNPFMLLYWLPFVVAVSCAGLLHQGLLLFAPLMIAVLTYFLILLSCKKKPLLYVLIFVPVISIVVLSVCLFIHPHLALKLVHPVLKFRALGLLEQASANSAYQVAFCLSSFPAFVLSTLNIYVHYMLAPFPWQLVGLKAFYACSENILRLFLLLGSIFFFIFSYKRYGKLIFMLLFLYFLLTLFWSLGTLNYGTGLRHHLTTYWILVLLGVCGFYQLSRRLSQKH